MRKRTGTELLTHIGISAVTGSIAFGGCAFLNGIAIKTGLTAGITVIMVLWTYILFNHNWPTRYRQRGITVSGEPMRKFIVNGVPQFLSTIKWFDRRETKPDQPTIKPFLVPHKNLVHPKVLRDSTVTRYAVQGWQRQNSLDEKLCKSPFASRHYQGWDKRVVSCCYRLFGESGLFDTYGQGRTSKLLYPPARAIRLLHYKYNLRDGS